MSDKLYTTFEFDEKSAPKFVWSNFSISNDGEEPLWLTLARAEEEYKAQQMRSTIKGLIKYQLEELDKDAPEEMLEGATSFCINRCVLPMPPFTPTGRKHWLVEFMAKWIDGEMPEEFKPYIKLKEDEGK